MTTETVHITTSDVARLASVDQSTVRRWVERGLLKPAMRLPGGHYRFTRAAVDELLNPQSTPSPVLSPQSPHPGEGVSLSSSAA